MYNRISFWIGLAAAFAVLVSPAATMAATTQSVGLDFTTADTLVLENDAATVDMGEATAADYDNGYIEVATSPDHTLNVAANTSWQVAVKGDTAETAEAWLSTGGDCPVADKPVSSIKYSEDDFGTAGTALSAIDVVVQTGSATGSEDILIDYQVDLSWTVDTGICTYDYDSVIYTLSAT